MRPPRGLRVTSCEGVSAPHPLDSDPPPSTLPSTLPPRNGLGLDVNVRVPPSIASLLMNAGNPRSADGSRGLISNIKWFSVEAALTCSNHIRHADRYRWGWKGQTVRLRRADTHLAKRADLSWRWETVRCRHEGWNALSSSVGYHEDERGRECRESRAQ
ncbi:hypothetical protein BV20DRAFT_620735 [Pilatotrama ljubarskyi]|nr:hypothetical protein BV20DRAFT_620735 [Pilatotrama ljubarskyi]